MDRLQSQSESTTGPPDSNSEATLDSNTSPNPMLRTWPYLQVEWGHQNLQ